LLGNIFPTLSFEKSKAHKFLFLKAYWKRRGFKVRKKLIDQAFKAVGELDHKN